MTIQSPQYSFVKFDSPEESNTCCNGDSSFCIPVITENDTWFQVNLSFPNESDLQTFFNKEASVVQLLLMSGTDNSELTDNEIKNWTVEDSLYFSIYRTGVKQLTLVWKNAFKDITTFISCDECFQLALKFTDGEDPVYYYSNYFKRKCDDCYTSVLEYYNDETYAGFNYCNVTNAVNRVRLPIYLTQPQIKEDKAVYRKSNGSIRQTRSLLNKEFTLLTEHFPETIHDKIIVALAHDNINILSGNYSGGVSKNADYAIEWVDNICKAPATTKVLATPFAIRNNNCQDCGIVPCNIEIYDLDVALNVDDVFVLTWTNLGGTPFGIGIEYSVDGGLTYTDVGFDLNVDKDEAILTESLPTDEVIIWRVVPSCDQFTLGLGEAFTYYPPDVDPPTNNVVILRNAYTGAYNISRLIQDGVNIYVGAALTPGNDATLNITNIANPHYFGIRVTGSQSSVMNLIRSSVIIKTFYFTPAVPDPINTTAWTLALGDIIEVKETD